MTLRVTCEEQVSKMNRNQSGGIAPYITLVVGLALMVGPWFVEQINAPQKMIGVGLGAIVAFFGLIWLVVTRLYVRTSADMAFVRTGHGGPKAVIDGGTLVIGFLHQTKMVPTSTLKLDILRDGTEALLTQDKLRARIKASFFVKVQKDPTDILTAASSLPDMTQNTNGVKELVEDKLAGALRDVAARSTLEKLNEERANFQDEVAKALQEDLKANGLSLESVTISELDQEDPSALKPQSNIFDSIGAAKIAEIVNENAAKKNKTETDARRLIADQDVATAVYIAEKDREREKAVAEANAQQRIAAENAAQEAEQAVLQAQNSTRKRQAELDSDASQLEAQKRKDAETERVKAEQAVALAEADKNRQVKVAEQATLKAVQVSQVEADQARELALRTQQIQVANADAERAAAEAALQVALKDRVAAEQAVETTQVVAEADRAKQAAVIAQQAIAEKRLIELKANAEADAAKLVTEATAKRDSAVLESQAAIQRAEGEKAAKELAAAGDKAAALVPVDVAARQVEVDQQAVAVLRERLEAESANSGIALNRELGLAYVKGMVEVGVAQANAAGAAFSAAKITVWGSGETLDAINSQFAKGQGFGSLLSGAMDGMPNGLLDSVGQIGGQIVKAITDAKKTSDQPAALETAESTREPEEKPEVKPSKPTKAEKSAPTVAPSEESED